MTSDLPSGPVVLDACVLFRGRLTDALLHLAAAGLFDPVWSAEIEAEWMRGLQRRRGILAAVVAERQVLLGRAFPGAACDPDPALIAAIQALCRSAAERKDAHVIATAVAAEARWIVTENTTDFPRRVLQRHGLQALRPDAFCAALLAAHREGVVAGLRAHRAGLREPACDPAGYLGLLAGRKMSLPQTARRLVAEVGRL